MTDGRHIPANLRPFVEALGTEAAVQFFLKFGGAEMYYAQDAKGNSELAKTFGLDAAKRLCAIANEQGLPRRVPLAQKWVAQRLVAEGVAVAEVARRLRATDSTIRGWTVIERANRQLPLFPDL